MLKWVTFVIVVGVCLALPRDIQETIRASGVGAIGSRDGYSITPAALVCHVCRMAARFDPTIISKCCRIKALWFCLRNLCRSQVADIELKKIENGVNEKTLKLTVRKTEERMLRPWFQTCRICSACYWGVYYACRRSCCHVGRNCYWKNCILN